MAVLPTGIGPVTGYNIERSLRFNSADSAYLNRTPASAGNRRTFTWSGWVKRGALSSSASYFLFAAGSFAGSTNTSIRILNDSINIYWGGTGGPQWTATAVLRDPSAWYHLVFAFDTTQATFGNRLKLYVNGVQSTVWSLQESTGLTAQNSDLYINNNQQHNLGASGTPGNYFDGYMTEVNFIDGQALTPSSFGETDSATGVWKPKAFSGTYGTNGFYLKFADNSGTTSTTLGKDSSGNGNNWTPNNFSVTAGAGNDSLVDSPTSYGTGSAGGDVRGNYCTWNRLQTSSSITLNNGNLDGTISGGFLIYSCAGTIEVTTSKWYYETVVTAGHSTAYPIVGVCDLSQVTSGINTSFYSSTGGGDTTGIIAHATGTNVYLSNNTSTTDGVSYNKTTDVLMIAFDADLGKVWFGKNGTWNNSSNPATNTGGHTFSTVSGKGYRPYVQCNADTSNSWTSNFGQRAFAYTAPSGFKALCTQNLPTPTIGATSTTQANDYFNAVLYTGDDTNRTIDCGLQTDFIWTKGRNAAVGNRVSDSVRGASGGLMYNLVTNLTSAENTDTVVTGIVSNGFTLTGGNHPNNTGTTYVAWGWKANGAGSSNTAGTITSTVSANTTSGFSIVTYTGNGSANQTVGHGLGVAPAFGILKDRDPNSNNDQWQVFHTGAGDKYGYLSTTAAFAGTAEFYPTSGSSTTVTIARGSPASTTNESGDRFVMYLFAPVAGYSSFGSYTGNASADGPFIYTGFRPEFVMIKCSSTTGDWVMQDVARSPYNVSTNYLVANASTAEQTGQLLDFVSNGFKIRVAVSGAMNSSGATYIFMAFAENPFKYSLAR